MKLSNACLRASQIESLLDGSLAPDDAATVESHLAKCQHCVDTLSDKIGPNQWWDDVARSLTTRSDFSINDDAQTLAGSGSASISKLLALLGPTDDPEMQGRIGPYEITGLLGQGGMGAVFKGFDRSLNRFVAIKMLLPHLATSGAARRRFAREGQAVAAVVDDHVMAVHAVDEWNGIPYLVMTYSRGVSLQKRLNNEGPLDVKEILRIGLQTARGLAAAHSQGIVHRDIKPANIFLSESVERVQLMDFGLARAVDDASLTQSGVLAGTPQYMSPEQARAESIDHRSDLFSLGSVIYAMCVGHAPFRGESSYSVLSLIADREPPAIREINPDIPEWLCEIIHKLMSKGPNARYQSADEVAELLNQCLAHVQQPTTTPLPRSLQAGQSDRRPPIGKLLTAAAFGFAFILAGVILVLELNKGTLHINCEVDNVPIRIMRGDEIAKQLTITKEGRSIRIAAGEYVVKVDGEVEVHVVNGLVKLNRGENETVKILIKPPSKSTVEPKQQNDSGELPNSALVLLMHPAELRGGNSMQQAAASVALGQLQPNDYCGILRFTREGMSWLWGENEGLVQIGETRAKLLRAITNSSTGDTPLFDEALQKALVALTDVDAKYRHMIILTDGDPSLNDRNILAKFSDAGIAISVVHIDLHGPRYVAVPKRIAQATGGRYYHVVDAKSSELESIFLRETKWLLDRRDGDFDAGQRAPAESSPSKNGSKPDIHARLDRENPDKALEAVLSDYIAAVKKGDVPAAQARSRYKPADEGFMEQFAHRISDVAIESMFYDGRSPAQVALALSQSVEPSPTSAGGSPIVRYAFLIERISGEWRITWVEPWEVDRVDDAVGWFRSSINRYDARIAAEPKPHAAPDLVGIWRAVRQRRTSDVTSAPAHPLWLACNADQIRLYTLYRDSDKSRVESFQLTKLNDNKIKLLLKEEGDDKWKLGRYTIDGEDLHVAMNIRGGGESYPSDPSGTEYQDSVAYMTLQRSNGQPPDDQSTLRQAELIDTLELAIRLIDESPYNPRFLTDSSIAPELLADLKRIKYWMNVDDLAIDEFYAKDTKAICVLTHQSVQQGPDWVVQIRADRNNGGQWKLTQLGLKERRQSQREILEFRHGDDPAAVSDPIESAADEGSTESK